MTFDPVLGMEPSRRELAAYAARSAWELAMYAGLMHAHPPEDERGLLSLRSDIAKMLDGERGVDRYLVMPGDGIESTSGFRVNSLESGMVFEYTCGGREIRHVLSSERNGSFALVEKGELSRFRGLGDYSSAVLLCGDLHDAGSIIAPCIYLGR